MTTLREKIAAARAAWLSVQGHLTLDGSVLGLDMDRAIEDLAAGLDALRSIAETLERTPLARERIDRAAAALRAALDAAPVEPAEHVRCSRCKCGWDEGTYDLDCECVCHTDPTKRPPVEPMPAAEGSAREEGIKRAIRVGAVEAQGADYYRKHGRDPDDYAKRLAEAAAEGSEGPERCATCGGAGSLARRPEDAFPHFCETCGGTGRSPSEGTKRTP